MPIGRPCRLSARRVFMGADMVILGQQQQGDGELYVGGLLEMGISHPALRFIRNHACFLTVLVLSITAIAAGLLRLYELRSWPIFVDEDMNTWVAAWMSDLPLSQAITLSTSVSQTGLGKPPLGFLLQSAIGRIVGDQVAAGRMLSATAGIATSLLCYFLGRRLGGARVGLVAAIAYAVTPLAILHERMAIQDGPMTALALGATVTAWSGIDRGSWRLAALASILGASAVQFKVPSVAVASLPILYLLLREKSRDFENVGCALLAASGPVLSYVGLMVSPLHDGLATQNGLLFEPLAAFWTNASDLGDTLSTYFPAVFLLSVLLGTVLVARGAPRLAIVYMAAILLWSVPWLVLSRFAPSRYYLPAVPYLCALGSVALVRLPDAASRRILGRALLAASAAGVILAMGFASVTLVSSHKTAALTRLDDWQYRSGWPSGYGYEEAALFISATAEPGSAVAYLTHPSHRIAIGFRDPLPPGVISLGLFLEPNELPVRRTGATYVVVDDALSDIAGLRLQEVMSLEPRLKILARFVRPAAETGVWVLWEQ
jgi:hypothetical protein